MKRLLLTSAGLKNKKLEKAFLNLLDKKPSETKLVMISTSNRTKIGKYYVNLEVKSLLRIGLKRKNITVLGLSNNRGKNLSGFDVIFVCGGNTYHYLSKIRKLGLDKEIKKHVKQGKVYFGISAGSYIVGNTIKHSTGPNDIGLTNNNGFGFVDCVIKAHYTPEMKETVAELRKKFNKLVVLTDDQALLILGDKQEII